MLSKLNLEPSYNSCDNDIVEEFYNVVLSNCCTYDRASAYFSAKAISNMSKGIENFYVDCSSSFNYIDKDLAKNIIRTYGADKVLFATDYPMWDHKKELEYFFSLGLDKSELENILNINAKKVFGVETNEKL